jgi:hypothetical protein
MTINSRRKLRLAYLLAKDAAYVLSILLTLPAQFLMWTAPDGIDFLTPRVRYLLGMGFSLGGVISLFISNQFFDLSLEGSLLRVFGLYWLHSLFVGVAAIVGSFLVALIGLFIAGAYDACKDRIHEHMREVENE